MLGQYYPFMFLQYSFQNCVVVKLQLNACPRDRKCDILSRFICLNNDNYNRAMVEIRFVSKLRFKNSLDDNCFS